MKNIKSEFYNIRKKGHLSLNAISFSFFPSHEQAIVSRLVLGLEPKLDSCFIKCKASISVLDKNWSRVLSTERFQFFLSFHIKTKIMHCKIKMHRFIWNIKDFIRYEDYAFNVYIYKWIFQHDHIATACDTRSRIKVGLKAIPWKTCSSPLSTFHFGDALGVD